MAQARASGESNVTSIAGYDIQRELGRGGMATVYLAVQQSLSRPVALKVLAPHLARDPVDRERFLREARFAANLHHPNIVEIYAVGESDGSPFMAMGYEPGGTAAAVEGTTVPPATALRMVRDIADALDHAHRQGVVHRDVKPDNILVRANGTCVLTDFGIAQAASQLSGLTTEGTAVGTPHYMSPEQLRGDAVDGRSDIYSLGIVMFQLLTGDLPFRGTDGWAVGSQHINAPIPRLPAGLGHLQPLLDSMIAKQPQARPQTGAELVRRIDALLAQPVSMQTSILPSAAATLRPGRGKRLVVPVVLGLAAIGAVGLGIAYLGRQSVRPGAASVSHSPARAQSPLSTRAAVAMVTPGGMLTPGATHTPGAAQARAGSAGYDLYLLGKVRVSSENRGDNDAAIRALRQAIAANPGLAVAHATLARAYSLKVFYFAAAAERKQLNESAEVEVETALALDPRSAEAYFARGLILWTPARRFPHDQAVRAYQQAIALDPTMDEAHAQLAMVYAHVGLLDRAKEEYAKALAINPGNTMARFRLGGIYFLRGEYERAYGIFNSTPLERNPTLLARHTATVLFRLGRTGEASQLLDKFLREHPADEGGAGHGVRAMILAKAGSRAGAEAEIATAIRLGQGFGHFHHTAYDIASAYALMGNHARAMYWLQSAVDDGFPCYPLFASDTQLDSLRSDKDFIAMMQKLKADWSERQKSL